MHISTGAHGGQERASNPLEREPPAVGSSAKLEYSAGAHALQLLTPLHPHQRYLYIFFLNTLIKTIERQTPV